MLVCHQVIHCLRLVNHFICPIQSQIAGVSIKELPKFLEEDSDEKTHAIIVNVPLNPNQSPIIPLVLKGVTSYFPPRKPRSSKYEDESIPHIDKTSESPMWEPYDTILWSKKTQ